MYDVIGVAPTLFYSTGCCGTVGLCQSMPAGALARHSSFKEVEDKVVEDKEMEQEAFLTPSQLCSSCWCAWFARCEFSGARVQG